MSEAAGDKPLARGVLAQAAEAGGWMVLAIASFSAMAVAGRELGAELATHEIMVYRSAFGLAVIAALIWHAHGRLAVATGLWREHTVRNIVHFAAQNAWFGAVMLIPLAQMVALEFTSPVWLTLLAPLMLGERITRAGVIAVALGFGGILLVTQPWQGAVTLGWGHLMALGAAVGFALTNIFTKRLSRADGALTILFWMTGSQMVMGLALTVPAGGPTLFSWALAPWVLAIGVVGLTAHFGLTRALMAAPATVVAPLEFFRLPVLAIAGMLLYGEALEVAVFAGAALILAGNLYNLTDRQRAEARR
ncbi:MAG: DMT family transporter [Pseudomonadota bacterium]